MQSRHSKRVVVRESRPVWLMLGTLALVGASAVAQVPVTVETTDCVGDSGFASFDADRLVKIQAAACPDPTDSSRKLQQILLTSDGRVTNYEVLTVTMDAARQVMDQIREVREARLARETGADITIRHSTETAAPRPEAEPPPTASTRGDPSAAIAAPPRIVLIEPPLSDSRSLSNVVTAPSNRTQQVVGRVQSRASILSLSVNGEAQTVSSNGLFTADVELDSERTPVSIVAVDENGQRSSTDFIMIRETPAAESPSSGHGEFGNYHALIIANNVYTHLDDLATPADDANAIGRILRSRYGFETRMLFDATRYEMLSALNEMRASLTENDNLLIYFAGHGAYDSANLRGHWLPVDAEHDSTANWVSTIDITDLVNAMTARHVLVVADSCYSGALTRSELTSLDPGMSDDLRGRWLRAMAKTRSRLLFTSGGVKPIVDDGGSGHSIFANALIRTLNEGSGIIESSTVFRKVKEQVIDRAEELRVDQTPQFAQLKRTGHEYGEFMFVAN